MEKANKNISINDKIILLSIRYSYLNELCNAIRQDVSLIEKICNRFSITKEELLNFLTNPNSIPNLDVITEFALKEKGTSYRKK